MGKIQIDCVWLFQIEQGVLELQDIWMKLEFFGFGFLPKCRTA